MKKVAILIPIFNGLESTKACLQSLYSSLKPLEQNEQYCFYVLVIDDGSTDGSAEWIRSHYPQVVLLFGDGNLWWSGGINVGAHYAIESLKSDYLVLWNNDIFPNDNYFSSVLENLESNPAIAIMGSLVYIKGTDRVHSYGGYYNKLNGRRRAYNTFDPNEPVKEVDWLPGMGTIVKSEVAVKTGYWDAKKFPQYMGDSDFILRAGKLGYKAYVFSNLVLHNNTDNTGIHSKKDMGSFLKSFYSRRSNYNLKDNYRFFLRHSRSPLALYGYAERYAIYILSFIKSNLKGGNR